MPDEIEIRHEESGGHGSFFVELDGKRVALEAYRRVDDRQIVITHTEVDDVLRGHGVARRLLDAAVAWARSSGTRVTATCPYVLAQFEKDSSIRDVLAS